MVEQIIRAAWAQGRRFRVIICDSRPKLEGRELLRRLVPLGIPCTYIFAGSLGYVIKTVTKVFVGAYACLSNGAVISRIGMFASVSGVEIRATGPVFDLALWWVVPHLIRFITHRLCSGGNDGAQPQHPCVGVLRNVQVP